tara:strand:+ start:250 stop:471 length:222 start_codon:yes stop_codon:yes gene_type:complete
MPLLSIKEKVSELQMTYKKLVKHKRSPRKETKSFSKNTEKTVYQYGDGAYKTQSHLSGRYTTYNSKGRVIKNR